MKPEYLPYYEFSKEEGKWSQQVKTDEVDGQPYFRWYFIPIVKVPVDLLIEQWEDLVNELSDKELELYRLKEAYLIAEQKIINETDFKELYGKNNEKVRTNHVKNELSDMVSDMKALEFGINWIRGYIPLLKEVIRSKQ